MAEGGAVQTELFEQPDDDRDFALVVEGRKLYVSRAYLACLSPVLRKVFFRDGFKPNADDGMKMKDKNFEEFVEFLHCVCPTPRLKQVDESNVALLLAYADEYDVAVLVERCLNFLLLQLNDGKVVGEGFVDYLQLAAKYRLTDLQKQLVPLVAQLSVDQIKAAHEKLPSAVLSAVYQSKVMHLSGADKGSKCSFECAGCRQSCVINRGNRLSMCCARLVYVGLPTSGQAADCTACKKRSADRETRAVADCVCRYADFSAELLDKND